MKKSIRTICKNCGAELQYKAVRVEEIKRPHKAGSMGAYCGKCGKILIQ